ncbi:MAG: cysteine synthase family protein [Anaerolineales bacterium]
MAGSDALSAIGGTPLVKLNRLISEQSADVYVKLESLNPTGSYKDRMALAMIEAAEERGDLRPGMTVVEYTGGSTGTSLAFVCAVNGYRFQVVSSDAFSAEKLQSMEAFGAELHIVRSEDGVFTPDLMGRMMGAAEKLASAEGTYFTNQLHNRDSLQGYARLGREILEQVPVDVDAFCASFCTAGMVMGAGRALKDANPAVQLILFEPAEAAMLTTGKGGKHDVEGIGIGLVPPLLDADLYDEVRAIRQDDALDMARRLARQEGLFVGKSSGLNVAGALQVAAELSPDHTVVTVAVDSGMKYLAGGLFTASDRG